MQLKCFNCPLARTAYWVGPMQPTAYSKQFCSIYWFLQCVTTRSGNEPSMGLYSEKSLILVLK